MAETLGIGLMSGTSGDGVDAALVGFGTSKPSCKATVFLPFPKSIRDDIRDASRSDGRADLLCDLHARLGVLFGKAALKLCAASGTQPEKITFIGSHGQTVRHQPSTRRGGLTATLQIGDPARIAQATGVTVVADFRQADIAEGGCGAPLAPLAHHVLFSDGAEDRVVQNLGGISNVTWLSKRGTLDDLSGFDTGPANCLLDLAVQKFSRGKRFFDRNGAQARKGLVHEEMFAYCMAHPYYRARPPKSTGWETFGKDYFAEILRRFRSVRKEDFLMTLSAVTAESSVSQALRFFKPGRGVRWIVCGGGALNRTVTDRLQRALGDRGTVTRSSELGYAEKSVEAVLMALLAHRTLSGKPGNLPRVTGAKRAVMLGNVTPGKRH